MAGENDSGHFRIAFMGYHPGYGTEDTRAVPGLGRPESAWDTDARAGEAAREEERAYFQADISWLTLGHGDAPESVAAYAQVAGDVGRARGGLGRNQGGISPASARPPLSLGTFVLVKGKRAIAIRNHAVLAPSPARAPAFPEAGRPADPPPDPEGTGRHRIVITYEIASALARMDQGFGPGIFPVRPPAGSASGAALTLFFRIESLS